MSCWSKKSEDVRLLGRRSFLCAAATACAVPPLAFSPMQFAPDMSRSLSKEERDSMAPSQVIDELKKGNERFRTGNRAPRSYLGEKRSSVAGQYPAAVILGCIDSRVPAEIVFDAGIGDVFVARVAGNVVNDDMLGSIEFGCKLSGAKLVLILGHTTCGAVKGAINDVVMGNMTGLLARVKAALPATKFEVEQESELCGCCCTNKCLAWVGGNSPAQPRFGRDGEERNDQDQGCHVRPCNWRSGVS